VLSSFAREVGCVSDEAHLGETPQPAGRGYRDNELVLGDLSSTIPEAVLKCLLDQWVIPRLVVEFLEELQPGTDAALRVEPDPVPQPEPHKSKVAA
jgi:hypothetical protein